MKKFILLILFIFLTLPCFAEDVLYLDKKWDKEASIILYEYALKKVNMTSKQALEAYGYKLEDVRAVFYDLNSDGISEVIGYINAPSSWCREGMALFILQKVNNSYNDDLGYFNFYPEKGIRILNTKTDGYYDFERYFTKINFLKDSNEPLTYTYNFHAVAKYNKKYKWYNK